MGGSYQEVEFPACTPAELESKFIDLQTDQYNGHMAELFSEAEPGQQVEYDGYCGTFYGKPGLTIHAIRVVDGYEFVQKLDTSKWNNADAIRVKREPNEHSKDDFYWYIGGWCSS